jgi:hypothetical protein
VGLDSENSASRDCTFKPRNQFAPTTSAPHRVHYGFNTKDETLAAGNALGVVVNNGDSVTSYIIATACVICILTFTNLCISAGRGYVVERSHDATGRTSGKVRFWMFTSMIFYIIWWFATVWMVLILMGCGYWVTLAASGNVSINSVLSRPPPATPVAAVAAGQCPSSCLDLSYFIFLGFQEGNSCVCNRTQLVNAANAFFNTVSNVAVLIGGVWMMLIGALILLTTMAIEYARTSTERNYIHRVQAYSQMGPVGDKGQFSAA